MRIILSTFLALMVTVASAVTVATNGAVVGQWTADWAAAQSLAKSNQTFYLINFGKLAGCAFCDAARLSIWENPAFTQWATSNKIALVYADRENLTTQPGVAVANTYPGLQYYPTILIIDGAGSGKYLIGDFVCRYNNKYNGVKINLTPTNFFAVVNSFVNQPQTKVLSFSSGAAFGAVSTNVLSKKTVTVSNKGNSTMTVSNASATACFSIAPTNFFLYAGTSTNITVSFKPVAVTNYVGKAIFSSDATSGTNSFACTGSGKK